MDVNQTYNHFLIHTNVILLYTWNHYKMLIIFHLKNEIFKATATKEKKIKNTKTKLPPSDSDGRHLHLKPRFIRPARPLALGLVSDEAHTQKGKRQGKQTPEATHL